LTRVPAGISPAGSVWTVVVIVRVLAVTAIPETLTITVIINGFATVLAITRTIRFGVAVGEGSQLFCFGKDSSERHGSGRGARQGRDGGTEEDGNGRELHDDKTDVVAMWC